MATRINHILLGEEAFVYLSPPATNSTAILSFQVEDGHNGHAKINKKIKKKHLFGSLFSFSIKDGIILQCEANK